MSSGRQGAGAALAKTAISRSPELGLRYSLMRRGADGQYFEAPPDTVLTLDESARLRIEANEPGYLYVIAGTGALFTGPVKPREPVLVAAQPGTLYVILARQPDPGPLATLVARTRDELPAAQVRSEKPPVSRPRDEALYVVSPGARVLAEIQLNFR